MKKRIEKFKKLIFSREMSILPGNLAFSFFLATIPILTLIFYFSTTFHLPMDIIQNFLNETFPKGVVDLLEPIFADSISLDSIITLVVGLTVAANGCNAIIIACNTIYNMDNAPYFKRMIKAVFMIFCILLLFAFIVVVQVLGDLILKALSYVSLISSNIEIVSAVYVTIQIPISLIIVYFFIKLIYSVAPDEKVPSKYMKKGSLFTSVTWLILTYCFSYYINNIADYSLVYGNLANIVMLLLWFYSLAYIFVIGLNINKMSYDEGIEKTNMIRLDKIRQKVNDSKKSK